MIDFSSLKEYGSSGVGKETRKDDRHIGAPLGAESIGVGGQSDGQIGHALGEFMKA